MIHQVIKIIQEMKANTGLSYPAICEACELEYSSFARWLGRYNMNESVVSRPGPKKVKSFELENLQENIRNLKHGKKRTAETGKLYAKYEGSVSRRDFGLLVSMARKDVNHERAMNLRRIDWKAPGTVWSMDDTELGKDPYGNKVVEHMVTDLSSRYKFPPVCGPLMTGKKVAANLEKLFKMYGPPLFLKRDNHGNLNSWEVNAVLKKYFVIPLNSPEYYSPYNGSVEKANRDFKDCLVEKLENLTSGIREHLQIYSETAVHDLNHKHRDCLQGEISCQRFYSQKNHYCFNKRERRLIYNWIKSQTWAILHYMKIESNKAFSSAWRVAAETWLRMKGFIFVSVNGKVLPNFSLENSHN
jgi:hypothetical protein